VTSVIESEALRRNLAETAVTSVAFDPKYQVLKDAFQDYKGVSSSLDQLLFELHHPYRNWIGVISDLRSFALKNLPHAIRSPLAVEAVEVLAEAFLDLMETAPKSEHRQASVDGLLAFLEKVSRALSPDALAQTLPPLKKIFGRLYACPDDAILAIAKSHHPLARTLLAFDTALGPTDDTSNPFWETAAHLLSRVLEATYAFWQKQKCPVAWLEETSAEVPGLPADERSRIADLLAPVSANRIAGLSLTLHSLSSSGREAVRAMARMPGHLDIVRAYRDIANTLTQRSCALAAPKTGDNTSPAREALENITLLFLFHLVEIEPLSVIHEEILRQINRSLLCLVKTAEFRQLQEILPKNFELLRHRMGNFPLTALQCIEALGNEVFRRDSDRLTELFLEHVVDFGFQTPKIHGVDAEWQIQCNASHLHNIRTWLRLICHKPKACGTLLSALIINIKLTGTCIKDTDLFQKDVTQLLNCDIETIYNLVKQFCRLLPVYFSEIGAEGLLRDVSTEIDEIHGRRDPLIHFLRKQCHVESSDLIVDFIEAILCFWFNGDKKYLTPYLPPEILSRIMPHGPYVDHLRALLRHLAEDLGLEPFAEGLPKLLHISEDVLSRKLEAVENIPPQEKRRLQLLLQLYRLETLKYRLGTQEIRHYLEEARAWSGENVDAVLRILDDKNPVKRLRVILDHLEALKKIILSPERFEAREDIYFKRHIAVDIPSMYGRYHERKFDALGMSFRLEQLANRAFEELVSGFDLSFLTREGFIRIARYLRLFYRAIQIDGIHSKQFSTYLTLLEQSLYVKRFSFPQYLDIVKGLSEGVKDMINVYYISPHATNIPRIVSRIGREDLLPKYRQATNEGKSDAEIEHHLAERFLRDMIASSLGLQQLDTFLGRIHHVLSEQNEALDPQDLDLMLSYSSDKILCPIHEPVPSTRNLIHLGNKGFNLVLLAEEGLPVPPGTIVTTEVFRCSPIIQKFPRAYRDFKWQLLKCIKKMENMTGKRYGDPANPLLLSVRSGAAISMPGMMATIINVGCNPRIAEGLSKTTGNPWFSWDNYRRFLQSWAMALGMDRDPFTQLMIGHKKRHGVEKKRAFTGDQMKDLALSYRRVIEERGLELTDDPFEQLLMAIRLVLSSWDSPKAHAYREIMGISDRWGTAVIIQAMAFGNISLESGTGVVLTANPQKKLDQVCLWGDFTPGNQGEDIVSGLVSTYPISIEQKEILGLDTDLTLEEAFPEIYSALLTYATRLIYEGKWTPQEIEFTFESPSCKSLYILQTRNMTTRKREKLPSFVPGPDLDRDFLGHGIGVSGGSLSGKAVFSLVEIEKFRAQEPNTPLILVRSDTVPDDIREIAMTDGLLTSRGGQTSHAAIVALRLNKTCVVGVRQLQVFESKGLALFDGKAVHSGDLISIDGKKGMVYKNRHPVRDDFVFPYVTAD